MSSLAASRHRSRSNFLVTNGGWQWPAAASRYFWKHTNWVYCTGSPLNMDLSQGRLNIYEDLPFLCTIMMFTLIGFSLPLGKEGRSPQLCVSCRTVPPPGVLPPKLSTLMNALLVLYKQAAAQYRPKQKMQPPMFSAVQSTRFQCYDELNVGWGSWCQDGPQSTDFLALPPVLGKHRFDRTLRSSRAPACSYQNSCLFLSGVMFQMLRSTYSAPLDFTHHGGMMW